MDSSNLFDQETPSLAAVVERAGQLGLRQVAVVAWRDLDAPDAGGAEVHLTEVTRHWVEAGLGVSLRTAAVPGGGTAFRRPSLDFSGSSIGGSARASWGSRRGGRCFSRHALSLPFVGASPKGGGYPPLPYGYLG
jgi:hypothetical protein